MNDQQEKNYPQTDRLLAGAAMAQSASCGAATIGYESNRRERFIRTELEVRAEADFSTALHAARQGHRITRAGWNAGGQWVSAQYPDKGSKMAVPYLYMKNAQNDFVPWAPSQGDLFASDWAVLPIQPIHS